MFLDGRPVKHNVPLFFRKLPERHISTNPKITGNVLHKRPHESLPWTDSPLVNTKGLIRHKRLPVHGPDHSRTAAFRAGSLAIKGQHFCTWSHHPRSTLRTKYLLLCCHGQGRRYIMSIRTPVACKPRKHQTKTVQQLRSRTKSAPDSRHCRSLM